MTNKERLISLLGFAPSQDSVEGALLDYGIEGAETYNGSNIKEIKTAAIGVLEMLLTTADTDNSGPGFVIKYDREAVLKRIALLKGELGLLDESVPTIKAINVW